MFSATVNDGSSRASWKLRPNPSQRAPVGAPVGDVFAVEDDAALVGDEEAGDEVEDRRLAGAVRADEAEHFAFAQAQRRVVDGTDTAEAFRNFRDLEDDRCVLRDLSS